MSTYNKESFSLSVTPKSMNEDAHAIFGNDLFSVIAIADGLGSYEKAAEASQIAVDHFMQVINNFNLELNLFSTEKVNDTIYIAFEEIEQILISLGKENNEEKAYATTLIVAIKLPHKIFIAYVGNGAIFHLRQNMRECKTNGILTWSMANYLIPHTINQGGKEALYRYISSDGYPPSEENLRSQPTILCIDREHDNSMIVLATDGLFSQDQVQIGKVRTTNQTIALYDDLFTGFLDVSEKYYKQEDFSLPKALEEYLNGVKEKLDDDTTIGVLIDHG